MLEFEPLLIKRGVALSKIWHDWGGGTKFLEMKGLIVFHPLIKLFLQFIFFLLLFIFFKINIQFLITLNSNTAT